MLKIKDGVNLKELEKFGFKKNKDNDYIYIGNKVIYFYRGNDKKKLKKEVHTEIIKIYDRKISINSDIKNFPKDFVMGYGSLIDEIDVLYELIKADLVEKVD